jgi:hypothetical protein
MIKNSNLPLTLSLSKGKDKHNAMVRQAHHERWLNDPRQLFIDGGEIK